MDAKKRKELEEQGYRFVGNHSAIKVCEYCKKSLRDQDICYKETFYSINSHRCCQMTPSLDFCNLRCMWCWRDIDHTKPKWHGPVDDPADIIDGCIKAQSKYLMGFKGFKGTNKLKFSEAMLPTQFAISLAGEPTMYPKLPQLIAEIRSRNSTAFLVTNGTNPSMLNKILKCPESHPTNLYITLPAPDFETFKSCCRPLINPALAWKNILRSLKIMSRFPSRTTIRITATHELNMHSPKEYARLISIANPDGVEVKGYMWVGYSRMRLKKNNMQSHEFVLKFAQQLSQHLADYDIMKEKKESRVILLEKKQKSR
jgi:tRNA wybutosine-synthesizing protein 1